MLSDKELTYLETVDGLDFYEFRPRFLHYFYQPLAGYESLRSRTLRETLDYIRGGYRVIYIGKNDRLIGQGTIVKGGGRYRFCSSSDRVICNLFVHEAERGKGYAHSLVSYLSRCGESMYAFIRHNNPASIKCFLKLGYDKVANASYSSLHFVNINPKGHLGIYHKKNG